MRRTRSLRLGAMVGLSAACGLASLAGLIALNAGGALSLGPVDVLPVAAGYDRRATRDLGASAAPPAAIRQDAIRRSRAALAQFPYDTGAWLRIAYLNQVGDTQLTADGLAALRRSYDLVAVDPDFGFWRVGFALEHSQALPKPLRTMVRQEVSALWTNPESRGKISNLQRQIHNPAGRLSMALWINLLQANEPK